MQFLFVLQDFQRHMFFLRMCMIHATKHHTKRSPAQFLHNLVSIVDLIRCIIQVVTILGIETIVKLLD